ncbi:MAG TPA: hypothetical protein VEF89_26900 [Solirubrobacteraceae bacterium]|nr:hypothetical protein [Solirubrobacteraceae bacterium]
MAQTFSYEFSTSGTPEEAEARLQGAINERLRRPSGGSSASNAQRQMRLSKQTSTSLSYKPKLLAPLPISLSIWLGRRLQGENVDVQFADGGNGQTRVSVSGKVGHGTQAIADRDFWTGVLSVTPDS